MNKPLTLLWKAVLGFFGAVFYILSLPPVRNFVWKRLVGKGQAKVVDAQARVVEGEEKKQDLIG